MALAVPLSLGYAPLNCISYGAFSERLLGGIWEITAQIRTGVCRPSDIAFDGDGVLQHFAIQDQPASRTFYRQLAAGEPANGSVLQYFMEIPGMAQLALGLSQCGGHPLLVSSMPLSRGLAFFNAFPVFKVAFLGVRQEVPVTRKTLEESRQVFFAEDLARGMRRLVEIGSGGTPIHHYPKSWHPDIRLGIRALCDPVNRGRLLKNSIVVALSKPSAPKPKILIEDAEEVVAAVINYSVSDCVVQPQAPWRNEEPFYLDPRAALRREWNAQALSVALALHSLLSVFASRSRNPIRIYINRTQLEPLTTDWGPVFAEYRESADTLVVEYYAPRRELARLVAELG